MRKLIATLIATAVLAIGGVLVSAPAEAGTYSGGYLKCTPVTKVDENGTVWYFAPKCVFVKYPPMTPKKYTFSAR